MQHQSHGRIDTAVLCLPASSQHQRADPRLLAVNMMHISLCICRHRQLNRRLRKLPGIIHCPGVAPLGFHQLRQLFQSTAVRYDFLKHGSGLPLLFCLSPGHQHPAAQNQAQLHEILRPSSLQSVDGLLHLQGIAYGVPQRLIHIGDHSRHSAPGISADLHHLLCQSPGICLALHEGAAARLHIQHNGICPCSQLFAHDGAGNQRHIIHGCSHIPQRIQLLVRRGQVSSLAHNGNPDAIYIFNESLRSQCSGKAWKAFQLIDGSARMAQPPSTHLGHRNSAGRSHRPQRQRGLVPHASGAVFIHLNSMDAGQIQHISAASHGHGQRKGLPFRHFLEKYGHHQGRNLIIRNFSLCVPLNKKPDLFLGQFSAAPFFQNNVIHSHGHTSFLSPAAFHY